MGTDFAAQHRVMERTRMVSIARSAATDKSPADVLMIAHRLLEWVDLAPDASDRLARLNAVDQTGRNFRAGRCARSPEMDLLNEAVRVFDADRYGRMRAARLAKAVGVTEQNLADRLKPLGVTPWPALAVTTRGRRRVGRFEYSRAGLTGALNRIAKGDLDVFSPDQIADAFLDEARDLYKFIACGGTPS